MKPTMVTAASAVTEATSGDTEAPPRVLVITQRAADAAPLIEQLEREGFAQTWTFDDPGLGLAFARREPPDLVVVDTNFERRDTMLLLGALRRLRTREHRWPILAIGRTFSAELRRSVILMGANDFVARQYDEVEVVLRIRRLLRVQRALAQLEAPDPTARRTSLSAIHEAIAQIRANARH